jgi:hypothetical protein
MNGSLDGHNRGYMRPPETLCCVPAGLDSQGLET